MTYYIILACLILFCFAMYFIFRQLSSKGTYSIQIDEDHNVINTSKMSCSCNEWIMERGKFKQSDPRRLCVHLCETLAKDTNIIPKGLTIFAKTITLMSTKNMGIPHKSPAFAFVLGSSGYIAAVAEGKYPKATVFSEDKEYQYNIKENTWKDELTPEFSTELGELIKAEIHKRLQHEKNKLKVQ